MKSSAFEQKYHVFLSFRGRDLRRGFVDHLYSYLTTVAKLNVFLDSEEIDPGDEIARQIEKAIQGSSIRIPIFSSNYAESAWCLKEVALMCASPQSLIIPLFYNVTPADVRYPDRGPFAPFFEKHKQRFPEHTIAEWKSALFTVSSLSGWSLDLTQGYEGKLVKLVTEKVLNKLNNVPLDVPEFVVGLLERKNQVIKFLGIEDKSCLRTVGICGMGGVGKTTLVKAIYNEIYLKFEATCFMSDVRRKAQQINGIIQIQNQMLHDLLRRPENQVNDVEHGKALIRDRLRCLRCLVILDNVDSSKQLDAIRRDWFGGGSRIIVTSRDKNSFNTRKGDKIYDMEGIPDDEALQLFSWHAFGHTSPEKEFEDLSLMVVERCCGLPLSLKVLGRFLYEKRDKKIWHEALKQLESAMLDDIYGSLKISFDGLHSDEKEIFLDIACIFLEKDTKTAFTFWEASNLTPNIIVMNLTLKSLIKISDDNKFLMHDSLRDMARAIVEGESKEPGKRSRLWKPHEVQQVLKYNQGTKSVRCLVLDGRDLEIENFILDPQCLIPMLNLQLLWISGITFRGRFQGISFQGRFRSLSPNLRWLKLEFCTGLNCLGWDWYMKNLSILDLNGSDIKTLWSSSCSKVPPNLKVLNLNHCHQLKVLPDLNQCHQLEELCDLSSLRSLNFDPEQRFLSTFPRLIRGLRENRGHFIYQIRRSFSFVVLVFVPIIGGMIIDAVQCIYPLRSTFIGIFWLLTYLPLPYAYREWRKLVIASMSAQLAVIYFLFLVLPSSGPVSGLLSVLPWIHVLQPSIQYGMRERKSKVLQMSISNIDDGSERVMLPVEHMSDLVWTCPACSTANGVFLTTCERCGMWRFISDQNMM